MILSLRLYAKMQQKINAAVADANAVHDELIDSLAFRVEEQIAENEAMLEDLPEFQPRPEKKRSHGNLFDMRSIT
jgi:hypothetical protein